MAKIPDYRLPRGQVRVGRWVTGSKTSAINLGERAAKRGYNVTMKPLGDTGTVWEVRITKKRKR